MKSSVKKLFEDFFIQFPELSVCSFEINGAFDVLRSCYNAGGKLLACGNGGSAADVEHIVGELMNKFILRRPAPLQMRENLLASGAKNPDYLFGKLEQGFSAISLVSQTALMTAIINDIGADMVFAQQVYGYGKPGDVLFALSTSGNSPNVVNAVSVAKALGMITIGFTGESGGTMKDLCHITIRVPERTTFKIQQQHLPVYHLLCCMIEEEFFGV
ncbi:MAG TPA: SIS domain-containing protein [Chitinispirillaceae bacterium]|nr:SIS domain-containing protein [Chitinispirillaceae bacterium]